MKQRSEKLQSTLLVLLVSLVVVFFFTSIVLAQPPKQAPLIVSDDPRTVEDLIELALDNQAEYRSVEESQDIVGLLRASAIGQFLPVLSASAQYTNTRRITEESYLEGLEFPGVDEKSSTSSLSLTLSESLFEGGARYFGYKRAQLEVENTFLNTERSEDVLIAQVKTAYANMISAQRNLEVQKEVLEQRRESKRLAQARYNTGDVIELDVMQADIDLGTQENNVLEAEQSVENAREALNLTLGLDLDSRFPLAGDIEPELPELDPDTIVQTAMSQRPDYLAAQNSVKLRDYELKQYWGEYLPSASAWYQLSRYKTVNDEYNKFLLNPGNENKSFGLSLNWTLFDGFSREVRRQNAVIAKRQAQWTEHSQRNTIASSLRTHWRNLKKLYQQIQVLDTNRELARRQLDLEEQRYRVGASDQLNLRSAQVTFATSEQTYLAKVLEYYTTLASFERDLGTSLEEIAR